MHLDDETKRPNDIRLFNDVVVKIHLILMKHDMLCYDLSHTAKRTRTNSKPTNYWSFWVM